MTAAFLVSGCATTSFAPPDIPLRRVATDTSVARGCTPALADPRVTIDRNVAGAFALTDNFIIGYNCSMRAAADGRQPWEILSFLTLVGATAAAALGAGPDVAIVAGAANGLFTGANNYFAPREQTKILNDALDAFICIQEESAGISASKIQTAAALETSTLRAFRAGAGPVVTVENQFFNMVHGSLMQVHRLTAERLSERGVAFDAAGVIAEIERLTTARNEAIAARDANRTQLLGFDTLGDTAAAAMTAVETVQLDLNVLRPKLQECVTRAKV